MTDTLVRAGVSLHGILRSMEDLCRLDSEAQKAIGSKQLAVRFDVPGLEPLNLSFRDGRCRAFAGRQGHADIHLRFVSPAHFLGMMDGAQMPIPVRGFSKLGFLTNEFSVLAKRLEAYLRPDEASLLDDGFLRSSTILTAYTAFFALAQVANLAPMGKILAASIDDGDIDVEVKNGPALHLRFEGGRCRALKGLSPSPLARMVFQDLSVAGALLRGERDSFAAIGCGELAIWGRVHMIENLNKLLGLLPAYLG